MENSMDIRLKKWENIQQNENMILSDVTVIHKNQPTTTNNQTTPLDLCKQLEPDKYRNLVAIKLGGSVRDCWRPLDKEDSGKTIEFLTFDDDEGREVFWHSSSHIMGLALEQVLNMNLSVGPPVANGFYYEGATENPIKDEDIKKIEKSVKKITNKRYRFERKVLSKEQALDLFSDNPYKVEIINSKIKDRCTAYKCGPFIDLCRGPHIPNTGLAKGFKVLNVGSSYFLGDQNRDTLQRVYGVSFPTKKQLTEHLTLLEEAKKRDHRKLGIQHELFFFDDSSPGSCYFLPNGTHIYNKLASYMRDEYYKRGFYEVITPAVAKKDLWKISGHWDKYRDNMFVFKAEDEEFSMCPMNCAKHCIMFKFRTRSYRELPIRFADFGVLHRNEMSGALSGLTRVRKFCQDDAHIFCREDQIREEIDNCLKFLKDVYGLFGFKFSLELSTRPKKYIGTIDVWDKAEKQLEETLDSFGEWSLNEGDGAFYGPKIDIHLEDALKRKHQCATIQLDFNLPSDDRFDLEYVCNDGTRQKPVIIHRAIYGSFERFIAILTEHYGGNFPFWISPFQVKVVPVSEKFIPYAHKIHSRLREHKMMTSVDDSDRTVSKKVREAVVQKYNYIIVVGQRDLDRGEVTVRERGTNKEYSQKVDDFIQNLKNKII